MTFSLLSLDCAARNPFDIVFLHTHKQCNDMFAVTYEAFKNGEVCKPVNVFAKKANAENEEEKYHFFVKVGKKDIPETRFSQKT